MNRRLCCRFPLASRPYRHHERPSTRDMRPFFFRHASLCPALLLAAAVQSDPVGQTGARGPRQAAEPTVIFAVKKNQSGAPELGDATIDPVVVVEGVRLTAPPEGLSGSDPAAAAAAAREKRFIRDFYRPG